jgi:hypothetical protein
MANEFKRDVGKKIPKGQIKQWQTAYKSKYPGETSSVFIGRDVIDRVLNDSSVTGLSVLFLRKNEGGREFNDVALIGTTLDGKFVWKEPGSSGKDMPDDDGSAADSGLPCPPTCPTEEP